MIDARVAGKEIPKAKSKPAVHDNVVNLMDVLQRSLDESKRSRGSGARNGRSAAAADEKPKKTTKRKTSAA
jgi:non-homologous end joining protein Ku